MLNGEKRFDGIAISELENKTHRLEIDHETVQIRQSFLSLSSHCSIVEFSFDMAHPMRFRLDMLLPEDIANACVTLNEQVLIGFFSAIFPDGCEFPIPSVCSGSHDAGHEKVSTLVPGQFQSISFKWAKTDVLKFYFYYN